MNLLLTPATAVPRLFGRSAALDLKGRHTFAMRTIRPDVLVVEGWRKPPRWSRCASCRVFGATRLCHDRRLTLDGAQPVHIFTSAQRCFLTPVPQGVVSCFCETGGMNAERCNASELRDCPAYAEW